MADFDIEAYLEEQVSKGKDDVRTDKNKESESTERRSDRDKDNVSRRDDRDERRRDRDSSRDRRSRRDSRDRKSSRRSRSSSRSKRRRSRSQEDRRKRSSRSRSPERERKREEPKLAPEDLIDKYQIEYEKERKRLEEEAKRIEREKQREIDDLTKDQRTIFVGQLTAKVTESNLREFFSQLGIVKSAILIRDKHSGKHKGFGYVEMQNLESVPGCLMFNNAVPDFQKFPILVKASEAEKNFVAKASSLSAADALDPRIYIGNIHTNIDEDAIRTLAEQFGQIENMTLHRDELGNSKGYAFVRYRSPECAQMAMTGLSGMELVGRALKVGPVLDTSAKNAASAVQSALGGDSGGPNWKLDDDDGTRGMQLNAHSRQMLMAKLAQSAGMQVPTVTQPAPAASAPLNTNSVHGFPQKTFVIANMFDPATETEPNWDQEIREDVMDECRRFGNVELVYVEKSKPGGYVYVKFTQVDAAVKSAKNLHGRYFAGKMITVTYLDPQQFDSTVPQRR